jgi:glycine hydroxymethyltransferase
VFAVQGRLHRHTVSQHVAVEAVAYGGGNCAASLLEQANLLMSGIGLPGAPVTGDYNGIRIGTQEVTRWGMRPADMRVIAELMARVLVKGESPARVRGDVIAFRRRFQALHFVRGA